MNDQRINQLIQSLQLREESINDAGIRVVAPTITGDDRIKVIAELVKLLTIE
jgi:hypothetical protein